MEPTNFSPDDGTSILSRLWDAIRFSGPLEIAGLLAIACALFLLIGSLYLAKRPHHFFMLVVIALLIGASGYVAFDFRYVMVNLTLRDDQVRSDCERLRDQLRVASVSPLHLSAAFDREFPASFRRLGAIGVKYSADWVYIDLGSDGYFYCPQSSMVKALTRAAGKTHDVSRFLLLRVPHRMISPQGALTAGTKILSVSLQ